MTFTQAAVSLLQQSGKLLSVPPATSAPAVASRCCTAGIARIWPISLFRRWTTSGAIPAGARNPFQVVASKPGKPDSASVGSSGTATELFGIGYRQQFDLPAFTKGCTFGKRRKHHMDVATTQRRCRRSPVKRNMNEERTALNLQQFHRKVG